MSRFSQIKVLDNDASLDFIKKNNCSVARFGDGEVDIINGKSIPYQVYDSNLAEDLRHILERQSDQEFLVCLPDVFEHVERYNSSAQLFWNSHFEQYESFYQTELMSDWYGSTFLSRPYIDLVDKSQAKSYFDKLKQLWENKDVLIVEGTTSRSGVGNDLFDNAKSIKRIIGPSKNAYSKAKELFEAIQEHGKDKLVLLMLGPTAKVLAAALSTKGIQAIDLGHIDSEYEWFKRQVTHKVKLENKHTAEFNQDHGVLPEIDETYISQIVLDLSGTNDLNKQGMISVIVPVYNSEQYLERCLNSILSQTYPNFEAIVINDGSTDRSAAILEDYATRDSRIKVFHQVNQGPSAARNFALNLVQGDYITFIDSDDFVDDAYLEKLLRTLLKNDADIASTSFTSYNEERQSFLFFATKDNYFEAVYSPEEWLNHENTGQYNLFLIVTFMTLKLYKRHLFTDIEYPVGRTREDDAIGYKLCLRANKIAFINEGCYYYSQHADSLSKTVMLKDIDGMIANAEERIALLAAMGLDVTIHIKSYVERLEKCLNDAINMSDIDSYKKIKVKLDLIKNNH